MSAVYLSPSSPRSAPTKSNEHSLPVSIEMTPGQIIMSANLPGLFPRNTHIYIADVGPDGTDTMVKAAQRLRDLGYEPVPHFASRRLTSRAALHDRVKAMAETAGVRDVLVIGGGLDKPAGDFSSTIEVLETGILDAYGITKIGIAGHPEGSPDFSDAQAIEALRLKQAFARRTGAQMRIVTQFGFDPNKFIDWAHQCQNQGIDIPIHLGIAGPAKLVTLIKYAAICGVGNSIEFLKKKAGSLTVLVAGYSPEEVFLPIETHVARLPSSPIAQVHIFPFGGIKKTANWLHQRGTWPPNNLDHPSQ